MTETTEQGSPPAEHWLRGCIERSQPVAADLGSLFQKALAREVPGEIGNFRRDTASIRYLRRRRRDFPHRIVLFIYASRFDPAFAGTLLDGAKARPALPALQQARDILERKSALLDEAFGALVQAAWAGSGHHVSALMASDKWASLPLVWQVPAEDPARTGFPRDAMWWLTFEYLCEVSRAIVAYAGMTPLMLEELRHVRAHARLRRRLVVMDGDLRLYFADRDGETWPLAELPALLQRIEARGRRTA